MVLRQIHAKSAKFWWFWREKSVELIFRYAATLKIVVYFQTQYAVVVVFLWFPILGFLFWTYPTMSIFQSSIIIIKSFLEGKGAPCGFPVFP
jgi:hypothetical protein